MKKFSWQTLIVLLFIVATPAISFFVLMTGKKAGIEFYKDLKQNLGKVNFITVPDLNGAKNNTSQYLSKVLVFSNFTKESIDSVVAVFKVVNKIDQFKDEVDNLQFIALYDSATQTEAHHYFDNLLQSDKDRWVLLNAKPENFGLTLPSAFNVVIVDTVGVIRRYYDLRLNTEKKKFVENLSVMPNKKKVGNVVMHEQKKY